MENLKNPRDFFKSASYIKSQIQHELYLHEINLLSIEEKRQRLRILDITIENIYIALKLPFSVLGILGTLIQIFSNIDSFANKYSTHMGLVWGTYFALCCIVLLCCFSHLSSKKCYYGLYRSILEDSISDQPNP